MIVREKSIRANHRQHRTASAAVSAIIFAIVSASIVVLAGCSGADKQASKMTSFSTAENPESKAELFSLPPDQISHIQIVPVEQGSLPRTLRLSGAVEYNDF